MNDHYFDTGAPATKLMANVDVRWVFPYSPQYAPEEIAEVFAEYINLVNKAFTTASPKAGIPPYWTSTPMEILEKLEELTAWETTR